MAGACCIHTVVYPGAAMRCCLQLAVLPLCVAVAQIAGQQSSDHKQTGGAWQSADVILLGFASIRYRSHTFKPDVSHRALYGSASA
jgi:hypothetical protein